MAQASVLYGVSVHLADFFGVGSALASTGRKNALAAMGRRITGVLADNQNPVTVNGVALIFDTGVLTPPSNPPDPLAISGRLPDGYAGQVVSFQYVASGGVLHYGDYTIASGMLPDGLSMNAQGLVTGTRTTVGTSSWVVSVVDALGTTATLSDTSRTVIGVWATWNPFKVSDSNTGLYDGKTRFYNGSVGFYRSVLSTSALSGKAYFEIFVDGTTADSSWLANGGVCDETESLAVGYRMGGSSKSAVVSVPTNTVYAGGATIFTGTPVTTPASILVGVAVDVATRKVWLRSGSEAWFGGGNPSLGTSPTYVLSGTGNIFACGNYNSRNGITIVSNPTNMTYTTPSSFATGIIDLNPNSPAAYTYDLDFGTFNVGVPVTRDLLIGPYPDAYSQSLSSGGLPVGIFQTLVITGGLAYSRLSGSANYAGSYAWTESFLASTTGAQVFGAHKVIVNP